MTLDKDGYPLEHDLDKIRTWDTRKGTVVPFIELLEDVWNHDYGQMTVTGKHVRKIVLVTGGWSGNEEVIDALQDNIFWALYWQKSERGGRYSFRVRV